MANADLKGAVEYLNAMSESIKNDIDNNDSPRKRRKAAAKKIRDEQKQRSIKKRPTYELLK